MNIRYWLKHNSILAGLILVAVGIFLMVKLAVTPHSGLPLALVAIACILYIAGFLLAYWATRHD